MIRRDLSRSSRACALLRAAIYSTYEALPLSPEKLPLLDEPFGFGARRLHVSHVEILFPYTNSTCSKMSAGA